MAKYICTVCGFVYDEAAGLLEQGIAPGTRFEELPSGFACPICGAGVDDFERQTGGKPSEPPKTQAVTVDSHDDDLAELSPLELSALCTNLARGCEKQYKSEEMTLFNELANYFQKKSKKAENPNFKELSNLINSDIEERFVNANAAAKADGDRGAQRALVWSEKVTRILKSLIARYEREGEAMLANTGVYVCTICGFIYIGDNLPTVCPVCKVPNWKFEMIKGGN